MFTPVRAWVAALAIATSLTGCTTTPVEPASTPAPAVSLAPYVQREVAPNITFKDAQGQTHRLDEYKGKLIVLTFFAHFCAVCQKEVPKLQQFAQENADQVAFVPIEATGAAPDIVKAFGERFGVSAPLFHDPERVGAQVFQVRQYPQGFLISPDFVAQEDVKGAASTEFYKSRLSVYVPRPAVN